MTYHQNSQRDRCFECDECGEYVEFKERIEFKDAWDGLKEDGWRCAKVDNVWKHFCKDCVRAWAAEQRAGGREQSAEARSMRRVARPRRSGPDETPPWEDDF